MPATKLPPILIPALQKTPAKNLRTKTTINLQGLFKPTATTNGNDIPEAIVESIVNQPVRVENLSVAWNEFAEQRTNQAAEYQILKREFQFDHPVIEVLLTNPVEETLLENFQHEFIQFLRERLKNSELTIHASVREATGKKVIYTSKEKFEHLAEKNPYLIELKDRLGLDWDF